MQRIWARACGGRMAAALFATTIGVMWALAILYRQDATKISYAAHFVEQARSWLHGRFDVPAWLGHDLVHLSGKAYIVYPPLPALLMLPFVALLGDHFSDIWFGWIVAALNTVLLFRLLETLVARGWSRRTRRENAVLALTFSLGTIALWLSIGGTVWFSAQALAITFTVLMIQSALDHRWWLASAALGALFLTRSPDILGGLFVLVIFAREALGVAPPQPLPTAVERGFRRDWRHFLRDVWEQVKANTRPLLALAVPLGVALVIWLARNQLYFGHWLSSGYDLQVQQDYPKITHGLLNWRYVWPNFVVDFLNFPAFSFASPYDIHPKLDLARGGNGTSVFFTTPLFLLFFLRQRSGAPPWLRQTLWACVILLVGFALLWNGTGWWQVGARYLFDAYPFAFVLLAMWRARIGARFLALIALGGWANVAISRTFWCHYNNCLGASNSLRYHTFDALQLTPLVAAALAWWWLRREPARQRIHSEDPIAQDKAAHQDQLNRQAHREIGGGDPAAAHEQVA